MSRAISIYMTPLLFWLTLFFCSARCAQLPSSRVVISVDVGTESTRAAVFDAQGNKLGSHASAHTTFHPQAGWAEQRAEDWWAGLGVAVRGALAEANLPADAVAALCLATTSCTVLALDETNEPLRPALLWMDARSAPQAAEILSKGKGDPALLVNNAGEGPISAEWMLCKALWIKQSEPETWARAARICECQDWLQYKCTGRLSAGGCNVATRWHCDGVAACASQQPAGAGFGGRPLSLLAAVGLEDLASKWPEDCEAMGAVQGRLTEEAAAHLGLPAGLPLAQGGADAYVGLLGLGAATRSGGSLGLITGSSHLHLAVVDASSSRAQGARGVWGAYMGAPLSHLAMVEGGQSSTGAALQWARRLFSSAAATPTSTPSATPTATGSADAGDSAAGSCDANAADSALLSLRMLDDEAARVPIGCEGLTALETFQGSRTPETDPFARAALTGLTLGHTRAHVWRSLLEAVCLGTRAAVRALECVTGHAPTELRLAGGATRSPLWLQMHADATGLPVVIGECPDAPLLGGAILAAAIPGSLHGDVAAEGATASGGATVGDATARGVSASPRDAIERAATAMVRQAKRIVPNPDAAAEFAALFATRYAHLAPTVAPLSHRAASPLRLDSAERGLGRELTMRQSGRGGFVEPSVLAADKGALAAAAREMSLAGATWAHVDVGDGSVPAGRQLTSLGPDSVAAIRKAAPEIKIDVHLYTLDPEAHIEALVKAGADRITFQIEHVHASLAPSETLDERALAVATAIRGAGICAGICLAPHTPLSAIDAVVASGLVDLVDILAVLPGIGGQKFRPDTLDKVRELRAAHPELPYLMVDGGVDGTTCPLVARAGANVVVSGSYLFAAQPGQMGKRLAGLEAALLEHGE